MFVSVFMIVEIAKLVIISETAKFPAPNSLIPNTMPPAGGRGAVAGPTQDGHRAGAGRSRGGCKMVTWPLWDGYGAVMGRLWDGYGAPMHPDMRPRRARTKKERRRFGKPGNRLYFCVGGMAEWSIAAVLKTVELQGSGGSNPSPSADNLSY